MQSMLMLVILLEKQNTKMPGEKNLGLNNFSDRKKSKSFSRRKFSFLM